MRSNVFSLFFKQKKGLKLLEDKKPISSAGRKSSAWSYSYDLEVYERCQTALKLATKSGSSESDVEDKPSSGCFSDEDDNNFIFQGSKRNLELVGIERSGSVTESLNNNNLMSLQENKKCRQQNHTESESSTEESLNNEKRLRFSNVQNQSSWSARIIRSLSEEINNWIWAGKQVRTISQIQAVVADYAEQFIQDTTLRATTEKYEELHQAFSSEKMTWMKQVESLKRQNSLLKSELQDISKAYRLAKKELTDLKIFYNQNHLKIDVNRNTRKSVPFSRGIGRSLDSRLKEQVRPGVNKMFNPSEHKHSDVKLGLCNQTKHLKLEHRAREVRNYTSEKKNVLNVKKELYRTDRLKQASPLQKLLQNKTILQGSKDTFDSNDRKNFKVGNTNFLKIGTVGQKINNMEMKLEEGKPMKVKSHLEQHSYPRDSILLSNNEILNDTGVLVLQNLRILNKHISLKAIFPDHCLTSSDSRYPENQVIQPSTTHKKVLKAKKKQAFIDYDQISQSVIIAQRLEQLKHQRSTERSNSSISGITIKSSWL